MLVKETKDHIVVESPTCGTVREILAGDEYAPYGLAVCFDIKPTKGHFHRTFDESYFLLDGELELEIFDPSKGVNERLVLKPNELAVITKGIHHKIVKASPKNRLAVITAPPFHADDEVPSDQL